MSLPTVNGVGRLTEEPELKYTASGSAVVRLRLAFNSRKKDPQTGEWKDDAVLYLDGSVFGPAAENVASSLQRGMEVFVSGRLKTNSWEDKQGQRQQRTELLVDAVGPTTMRTQTARVEKTSGGGQGNGRAQFQQARQAQGGSDDPWAAAPAGQGAGGWRQQSQGYSDEPPF
ncbi:single-stranded DNA-binding protein [Streptomyces olivaceiscleroticus]|uniref:Single-stranded DNA-binding protein n=1 Tax=Streptomyces olivaceiscleroticus TaxID=68245 RepID=A0ABN1BM29_9ACTN